MIIKSILLFKTKNIESILFNFTKWDTLTQKQSLLFTVLPNLSTLNFKIWHIHVFLTFRLMPKGLLYLPSTSIKVAQPKLFRLTSRIQLKRCRLRWAKMVLVYCWRFLHHYAGMFMWSMSWRKEFCILIAIQLLLGNPHHLPGLEIIFIKLNIEKKQFWKLSHQRLLEALNQEQIKSLKDSSL